MHFSNATSIEVKSRQQDRAHHKPRGFWVSDESEDDNWSRWCTENEFGLGPNAFDVKLAPDASVLTLTTVEAIRDFHEQFRGVGYDKRHIDWHPVAKRWQGILITPYQWQLRLDLEVAWYYPWDCASGCIWDASAIASVTPVLEQEEVRM